MQPGPRGPEARAPLQGLYSIESIQGLQQTAFPLCTVSALKITHASQAGPHAARIQGARRQSPPLGPPYRGCRRLPSHSAQCQPSPMPFKFYGRQEMMHCARLILVSGRPACSQGGPAPAARQSSTLEALFRGEEAARRSLLTCCVRLSPEKEPARFVEVVEQLARSGVLQQLQVSRAFDFNGS